MPDVTQSVGEGGSANTTHDVAMVQAMLRVVTSQGVPYLAGSYDGIYGSQTKTAIGKFQTDHGLVTATSTDKAGKVMPGGETVGKLTTLLPATHAGMRIIGGQQTVYLAGSATDAAASKAGVLGDGQLDAAFRAKVGNLVQAMFDTHKIVLWVTTSGGRRTFSQQMTVNSKAGPGESNHQYGRAVDLGFKGFSWVMGNGAIKQDRDWLNHLETARPAKANAFWDARDAIALQAPISLFRLGFERIHLQSFNNATTSARRSLVQLLNQVGAMKWDSVGGPNRYKSNLGVAGKAASHLVGSAKQIWSLQAAVTATMIAAATGVKAGAVTAAQVTAMKSSLKADFEACEANWRKWAPVP